MWKVVLASKSPVKVGATRDGFRRMFPDQEIQIDEVSVSSGVNDQPMSDAETLQGVVNRADNAARAYPDADFWVGLEGGIDNKEEMELFGWVVVRARNGQVGKSRTCTFALPPKIASLINQGMELGDADDIVFGRKNSKQQNGAVGILTGNAIDRRSYYAEAMTLALVPFRNPELYPA